MNHYLNSEILKILRKFTEKQKGTAYSIEWYLAREILVLRGRLFKRRKKKENQCQD